MLLDELELNNIAIGIDIEKNYRFRDKDLITDEIFLKNIFTNEELEYCYSKKNFAQHLCARYCAKEAITKALCSIDISDVMYNEIIVLNKDNGCPYAKIPKYPNFLIKLSMSHTKDDSIAFAMIFNK